MKVQYYDTAEGKKFATQPTEWLNGVPTMFNADTLGVARSHRPPGRELEGAAEPRIQG
jgi:hypothetical protein